MARAVSTAEKIGARIAESVIVLARKEDGRILGVILSPRPTLVQLCFVAPGRLGKGIGRFLVDGGTCASRGAIPESQDR